MLAAVDGTSSPISLELRISNSGRTPSCISQWHISLVSAEAKKAVRDLEDAIEK